MYSFFHISFEVIIIGGRNIKSIEWMNKEEGLCKINLEIGDKIKIVLRSKETVFAIVANVQESMYHYMHENTILGLITNNFFEHKSDLRYVLTSEVVELEKLPALSLNDICVEWCPVCGQEVAIYSTGVSVCSNCGTILLPCSQCEECIAKCPYTTPKYEKGPEYFKATNLDAHGNPIPTNPPIMPHEVALLDATKSQHIRLKKDIYNPIFCRKLAKVFTNSDSYEKGYKIAATLLTLDVHELVLSLIHI